MSIWQTKAWGEMLKKSNQAEEIFEIDGTFVEKRQVGMGEYGLFVIGLEEKNISKELQEKLISLCESENALFLQVETIDYKNPSPALPLILKEESFKRKYYKKFITPYTAVIDLIKSEEEILKAMKPKGRYNIKLAVKKGVEVKVVEKNEENIKKFYDLMMETTGRDDFSGNTLAYYKTFLESLEESRLFLAYVGEKVIAAGIFVFSKDVAIYYYGASSSDPEYRNMMSPYLLQWKAIRYGKQIGSRIYDFLGVATPGDEKSSLLGVTSFKLKLTKDVREVSKGYIHVNKKIKYWILSILRKLKR